MASDLASWRAGIRAVVTTQDMADVAFAMVRAAKDGNVPAATLLYRYWYGNAPAGGAPPGLSLDPAAVSSIAGCREAAMNIMQAQVAGLLDHDSAKALLHGVDVALKTHTAEANANSVDALGDMASDFLLLESGRERESFTEIMDARDADGATDGD